MVLRSLWCLFMAAGIAAMAPENLVAQSGTVGAVGSQPAPVHPTAPGPEIVNTADPALPGAEEVVGDVQNALFWSRFQRGASNGWSYVLFPDGSATIMSDSGRKTAEYTLACTSGVACLVTRSDGTSMSVPATGAARPDATPPSDGEGLARYLAEWVLAGSGPPSPGPGGGSEPTGTANPADLSRPGSGSVAGTTIGAGSRADTAATEPSGATEVPGPGPEAGTAAQAGSASALGAADDRAVAGATAGPRSKPTRPDDPADASCLELPGFIPNVCDQAPVAAGSPRRGRPSPGSASNQAEGIAREVTPSEETKLSFAQRINLRCSVTGTFSLRYTDPDTQASGPGKPRVGLGCSTRFTEKLSFQFFFQDYLIPDQQQPWDPDFTYALTYRLSERFNLTYSNYLARFDGPNGEGNTVDSLLAGSLRGNFNLPRYEFDNGESLACLVGIGLPNVLDSRVTLSCGAGVTRKLRLGATAYLYFPGQQDTYQPDFSYTASYRISDQFRLTYSNYSNNRWSWNEGDAPGPGFVGGSLSLTYDFEF